MSGDCAGLIVKRVYTVPGLGLFRGEPVGGFIVFFARDQNATREHTMSVPLVDPYQEF